MIRLGVNIDHVATLRNARGESYPDPVEAAQYAIRGGADGITAHLREDRRHIRDEDIRRLRKLSVPLNFEMAATEEMVAIACEVEPHACCLVPEKREELTTEGGLNIHELQSDLRPKIERLKKPVSVCLSSSIPIRSRLKQPTLWEHRLLSFIRGLMHKGETGSWNDFRKLLFLHRKGGLKSMRVMD